MDAAKVMKLSQFLGDLDAGSKATRAQVLKTIMEALGIPETETGTSYSDVSADSPFAKAIATATKLGIVSGDSGKTTFRPNAPVNRAEVAKMIMEAFQHIPASTH